MINHPAANLQLELIGVVKQSPMLKADSCRGLIWFKRGRPGRHLAWPNELIAHPVLGDNDFGRLEVIP